MHSVINHNGSSGVPMPANEFHELYVALRETENRLCSDEELYRLPLVDSNHMYYREWQIRKSTMERFRKYLEHKQDNLRVLEIGCGNGWFSNRISKVKGIHVTGIDINLTELEQAKRVFGKYPNLEFILGEIRSPDLRPASFDIVVFSASIQYFQTIDAILHDTFPLLNSTGEIHIMDTKFYKPAEVAGAKERSALYFNSLGFDAMNQVYFHHCIDEIKKYHYRVMYDPDLLFNQILKRNDPFHWIMIKNE